MATVSPVAIDVVCADPDCDEIIRAGTEARVYRQGTFCLDGHERTGNGTPEAATDTWLSERLDRLCIALESIDESLKNISDTRTENFLTFAVKECHSQTCTMDHLNKVLRD